jgi:hypothetical protein
MGMTIDKSNRADAIGSRASPRPESGAGSLIHIAPVRILRKTVPGTCARGREMRKQDAGFDFHRYRQLLAEAVDEPKRLAFIDLLVEERAKERLDNAQRAVTIANVLGTSRA